METVAVEDLGFRSEVGSQIFQEFDTDGSGAVSYNELIDAIRQKTDTFSSDAKKLLTTFAFAENPRRTAAGPPAVAASPRGGRKGSGGSVAVVGGAPLGGAPPSGDVASVDCSGWRLSGPDAESLRVQLHEHLFKAGLKDTDLCTPRRASRTRLVDAVRVCVRERVASEEPHIVCVCVCVHACMRVRAVRACACACMRVRALRACACGCMRVRRQTTCCGPRATRRRTPRAGGTTRAARRS